MRRVWEDNGMGRREGEKMELGIDGMERVRRSLVRGIVREEGIGGLIEWRGEEEARLGYSKRGGYRRIDGMKRRRRRYVGGKGELMEWGGEGATYVGGILGEEGIGGLMEWGGEEGAMLEVL